MTLACFYNDAHVHVATHMAGEDLADRFEDLHIDLELPRTRLFRGDQCLGTGLLKVDEQ